jgi:ubiquinone/menaquinone biosynthesis C-methylase UbiE
MFEPITDALIEAAAIASGHSVLDVAGGAGEPSLTIAKLVEPFGTVTCTDAVHEMVRAAQREAGRRRLTNINFLICQADALPFERHAFDTVVCRLGIMFFPDPLAALSEMVRVSKPGGSVTLAVWSRKEFNPWARLISEIVSRYIEGPTEDLNAPGAFRFAEPGALASQLEQAGAIKVNEQLLQFRMQASISFDEFWPMRTQTSDTLREKLAVLSSEQRLQVRQEAQEALQEFFPSGQMSFPAQVLVVTGEKPRQ